MHYHILTIFPELFTSFKDAGLVGRAVREGRIELECTHLRDFAINTHGQIDDTPYGGGSGMVLRCEPAAQAIEKIKEGRPRAKVVLFTPRGVPFSRGLARGLSQHSQEEDGGLILLCSRYEGVDERIAEGWVDYQVSLGDYVLMGGEVAAMALIEATSRLLPEVLGNPESLLEESFEGGLLEYPQYTKPQSFRGREVPEVLLSGHHAQIESWRKARSEEDTRRRRPDLLPAEEEQSKGLPSCQLDAALIHFPVFNKEGKIVTSSVTNLDLHDIARSAKTFGLNRYYVVHPVKTLRRLMQRICDHWEQGYGQEYNPNRWEALETISLVPDFDDVLADIEQRSGRLPKLITTSARPSNRSVTYTEMRNILNTSTEPHLILFGTGWGLADEILERADYHLEPICGFTEYNHLSVRAAAAITFDRLLGQH